MPFLKTNIGLCSEYRMGVLKRLKLLLKLKNLNAMFHFNTKKLKNEISRRL